MSKIMHITQFLSALFPPVVVQLSRARVFEVAAAVSMRHDMRQTIIMYILQACLLPTTLLHVLQFISFVFRSSRISALRNNFPEQNDGSEEEKDII